MALPRYVAFHINLNGVRVQICHPKWVWRGSFWRSGLKRSFPSPFRRRRRCRNDRIFRRAVRSEKVWDGGAPSKIGRGREREGERIEGFAGFASSIQFVKTCADGWVIRAAPLSPAALLRYASGFRSDSGPELMLTHCKPRSIS